MVATSFFRKSVRWHVLAWLAFTAYSLLSFVVTHYYFKKPIAHGISLGQGLWLIASFLVVRIATFYFCYLLVYPRLLRVGRLSLLLLGLVAAVLFFISIRAGIEEFIYPALLGFHNYFSDTTVGFYIFDNLFYALPTLVLSAALWAVEQVLHRERENHQLSAEKRTAEAAFLKTQINPHFLYNTLNMLYGMAYGVDKRLANSLLKLSELMRYMLRDTPDGLVELSQEIDYLENFLDLYRLRYPGRLHAELTVAGDPAGHRVAPLLLIPFVENAFKHGVLDDPAAPVRLHLALHPGELAFTVENHRHHYQADATSGIGLANLARRLELLYPGRHLLHTAAVREAFWAHLQVADRPQVFAAPQPTPAARPAALASPATC